MQTTSPTEERKVWLYMVDGRTVEDLALLDFKGFDQWRANRHTRAGDLILMYRTAPFSDIAYVFVARSNPRPMEDWLWPYAIDIADGYHLPRVIKLSELRNVPALKHWHFLKIQRGMMQRSDDLVAQGAWPTLSRIIEERAPHIPEHFGPVWTGQGKRRPVFLSYAHEDKPHADEIYDALAEQGIDVWVDQWELRPGVDWDQKIEEAMRSSRAFVVCLSEIWLDRSGYVKQELAAALAISRGREKPFLFPVMVGECQLPEELAKFQAVRAYGEQRAANLQSLANQLKLLANEPGEHEERPMPGHQL